ncbi:repetitive organellar protein-like [Neodiprion pinetum]|uniref:repetitive organellar protein-like n=1 Tax=Neodiprion pinetum TaxID=441929 RepID=UPI001EDFB8B5|nr:uncharacterized protein LOC124219513 [Neodiprion pinetum]
MASENTGGLSGASSITPEFVRTLETSLHHNIARLENTIKQYKTRNATLKQELESKATKLKTTMQEIRGRKKRVEELKNTQKDLDQSNIELSLYASKLKADLEAYEKENIRLRNEHQEVLDKADAKWEIYKAQYEKRPMVKLMRQEEVNLKKSKIELMVKKNKLMELKKMIATRESIHMKQRNCLVVECANIYKEAESGKMKIRSALNTQKELQEKLKQQEAMIKRLEDEEKEKLKMAQEQLAAGKITKRDYNYTASQFERITIPPKSVPPTFPDWWSDKSDSISITSAMIDALTEPAAQLQLTHVTNAEVAEDGQSPDPHQSSSQNMDTACFAESNEQIIPDDENGQAAAVDPEVMNPLTEPSSKDAVDKNICERTEALNEGNIQPNQIRQQNLNEHEAVEEGNSVGQWLNLGVVDYCTHEEPDAKRPKVTSIASVKFNVPPKMTGYSKSKQQPPPSPALSNIGSISECSWRPKQYPSLSSSTYFRADRSILSCDQDSQQSADTMERFRLMLSPQPSLNEGENWDQEGKNPHQTPQPSRPAFLTGEKHAAPSPFVNISNNETSTASRGNKSKFSLNMF